VNRSNFARSLADIAERPASGVGLHPRATETRASASEVIIAPRRAGAQNTAVRGARLQVAITILAIAVTAGSYWVRGAHAAVLDSVRFSALIFAFALAARAVRSPLHGKRQPLTIGFAFAQYVHFMAVAAFAYADATHPLHSLAPAAIVTMLGGATHITVMLSAALRGWPKVEAFTFYLAGVFLLTAFAKYAIARPVSGVMAVVLLAALVYRVVMSMRGGMPAASAGAGT
jgi:hypothetical protein